MNFGILLNIHKHLVYNIKHLGHDFARFYASSLVSPKCCKTEPRGLQLFTGMNNIASISGGQVFIT